MIGASLRALQFRFLLSDVNVALNAFALDFFRFGRYTFPRGRRQEQGPFPTRLRVLKLNATIRVT
jgi:hypothetical protein